ncbi:MAG: hypothetical protein EA409_07010 [Saprospirales bacterium]|nr:MAG: hypothetical protein EA409_07010 [Saprospirales bacterium]
MILNEISEEMKPPHFKSSVLSNASFSKKLCTLKSLGIAPVFSPYGFFFVVDQVGWGSLSTHIMRTHSQQKSQISKFKNILK